MDKEKCPCCSNHCHKDDLKCNRGREYFDMNKTESLTIQEKIINDLRKCGHLLHHNKDINSNDIFAKLSSDDIEKLHELLNKICN